MKALIFAAGLGTRLRPLTDNCPKALAELNGISMLERVIIRLRDAGAARIVINVHHFPDMIIDFLHRRDFGVEIMVSDERGQLLDTGGGVLRARKFLEGDDPVIIHNADILTDFPLREMARVHEERADDVTLLVAQRESSRTLLFDDALNLEGWMRSDGSEIIPESLDVDHFHRMAFGGVHIVSPSVFPVLEDYARLHGEAFPIIPFYLSAMYSLRIRGYVPSAGYAWFDIGTPAKLAQAEAWLNEHSIHQ